MPNVPTPFYPKITVSDVTGAVDIVPDISHFAVIKDILVSLDEIKASILEKEVDELMKKRYHDLARWGIYSDQEINRQIEKEFCHD